MALFKDVYENSNIDAFGIVFVFSSFIKYHEQGDFTTEIYFHSY